MSVPDLLDRIGGAAVAVVPAGTAVGVAVPTRAADVPAVVLHVRALQRSLTGIGDRPAPSRTGALPVQHVVDLADSRLVFLDGSTADLVSGDRRTVFLPYGPAVAADGVSVDTLSAADLEVALDGAPVAVVTGQPGPGEVRALPLVGELRFADPLPATGSLTLAFHLGEWEVVAERVRGELVIDVYGSDVAEVDGITRSIDAVLVPANRGGVVELKSIAPLEVGGIEAAPSGLGTSRLRRLVYVVDAEIEDVVLGGGGGPIRSIDVTSTFGPEQFSVPVP